MARPKTTHCKRGHERVPGQKSCVACRRFRERWKYENNEKFRAHKKAYQARWRREFFEANGFWHSTLFERKPKDANPTAIEDESARTQKAARGRDLQVAS